MRKFSRRLCAFILTLITIFSLTIPTMAATSSSDVSPQASAYISSVWASCSRSGSSITVDFSITATNTMSSLGATLITVKNSSGTTVKSFSYSTTDGMMGYNRIYYRSSVTWSGASSSEKYYAIVAFKASNSSGSDTTMYTTSKV